MKFLIALLLCCHPLFADNELYVELASEVQLIPLYVSPIPNSALRDVLLFDLNHNGMTRVLPPLEAASKSALKGHETYTAPLNFAELKAQDVLYLVKLKIEGAHLLTTLVFVNSHESKTISGIELTGDSEKDRRKIHALSNTIHELLFGKKGIATSRILYTLKKKIERPNQAPTWISEVYEADYDGHNARQITYDNCLVANPQYIPNPNGARSNSFIYVSYKIGQPKLYLAPLHGSVPKRVSSLRANQLTPAISPDGKCIAFASDTAGKSDIFYQTLATTTESKPRQIFTAKAAANASPSFSPDGKKIAFVSNKDGAPKIYVMQIPSNGTRLADIKVSLISKRCRENSAPKWSPDGKKIAFCAKNGGDRQIWIYDFETNQERPLTQGPGTKENPAWAPDSLHLMYNATQDSKTELYLINLHQTDPIKITSGVGEKMFPAWEPQ